MNELWSKAYEYLMVFGAVVGVVTGAIVLIGIMIKPVRQALKRLDSIDQRLDGLDRTQQEAAKMRTKLWAELNEVQKVLGDFKIWKAGMEEAKSSSAEERKQMRNDIEYLEEKFDKLREKILDRISL